MSLFGGLNVIQVKSPCDRPWSEMVGNDRVRTCGDCKQNVYDLSAMTLAEAESLIGKREGRVCVRFFRRADGTISTKRCETVPGAPEPPDPGGEQWMGELAEPPPGPPAAELRADPDALSRDLVLAQLARSLRHTHPDTAEALLATLERVWPAGFACRCPHCDQDYLLVMRDDFLQPADPESLFAVIDSSLGQTRAGDAPALLRELRRHELSSVTGAPFPCSACNGEVFPPPGIVPAGAKPAPARR